MLDLSLMQPLKVNFIIFIYSLLLQLLLKHLFKQNHKKINFLNRLKKEKIFQFSPSLLANIYSITIILIPLCGYGETSVSLHFFLYFLKFQQVVVESFFSGVYLLFSHLFYCQDFFTFWQQFQKNFQQIPIHLWSLCHVQVFDFFFCF